MSWRAWCVFALLGIIWGVPYFFIKLAVQELSPFVIAWGRITLGALILLPVAAHRGALRPVLAHKLPVIGFALAEFAIPFVTIGIGEQWVDSSVAGIMIATVPLLVLLMSRLFGVHERLGAWRLAGLVVGLIGVMTLLGFGSVSGWKGWVGVGCLVVSAVGYATGPLTVQRYLSNLDSIGPIAASLGIASAALLLPAVLTWPDHVPSATALFSVAVLGVFCTVIAMLLMFYLISHAGAARASVITYINPAVATLLGVIILDEHLGWGGGVAFVLILLGSWLGTRGKHADPHGGPEPSALPIPGEPGALQR